MISTGAAGFRKCFSIYTSHTENNDPLLLAGKELDWTVSKLRESWNKNRDLMFLTPFIINLLEKKQHSRDCFFKGGNFVSFDARLNRKTPCVLGEGVNCQTCGCIVPMVSYALKRADIRSWFLLNRMFPQKFFKNN